MALGVFMRLWNFEFRAFFFFVGTIVLRYFLRYVLFISLVFFGAIHVRCVSEMWFRGLLDLCMGGLNFVFSELW